MLRAAGIRDQAPRPLVLAPEPGWTRSSGKPFRLRANDDIPFRLTLIGRAIGDVALVVVALQAMARRGIGIQPPPVADANSPFKETALMLRQAQHEREKACSARLSAHPEPVEGRAESLLQQTAQCRRVGLRLASVATADGTHTVYDGTSDAYTPPPQPSANAAQPADDVTLELVTPLRLKHNGRFANTVTPGDFLCALARRANALGVLHGAGLAVDETEVAAQAAEIKAEPAALRLVHVTRYSATQRQRMQWPGLMGRLRWRGAGLRALWPLLRLGEAVQVGKGAALGFGRYQVLVEP